VAVQSDDQSGFFATQRNDAHETRQDAQEAANIVEGFDRHRSTVVPWLRTTGIAQHVEGLRKDQIRAAVAIPRRDESPVLHIIVEAMQEVLKQAHSWCFDGPDCMLNHPCALALSRFQGPSGDTSGKQRAFAFHKDPKSLKDYLAMATRLLAYLYRMTQTDPRHFEAEDRQGPEDTIKLTVGQQRAWQAVIDAATKQHQELVEDYGSDEDLSDDSGSISANHQEESPQTSLGDRLVNLWMVLICHHVATQRYTSPLVSFCAMLSIQPTTGSWMKPGNYSSDLSRVIWVVQLIIFYHCADRQKAGEGQILSLIREVCQSYLQQADETPMGEILRWRLLLFHVRKHSVGDQEAVWDDEHDAVIYNDITLRMDHLPHLLQVEYRRCRRLLYHELLLDASDVQHMSATDLQDHPGNDTVYWSFKDYPPNVRVLQGTDCFLLQTIQQTPALSRLFVGESTKTPGGWEWRASAIASYEAHVQDFLAHLCVLIHISSGQPLREPEFFSMMWRNTEQRRHITVRFGRVMIHTTYGKQQQQQGLRQDSVRFLAQPIGNLLLDYLVYVLPLRERFLRQSSPRALLPPLLWEQGGEVWRESRLSSSLKAACVRAQIPPLQIASWRQITVAIVKSKFASDLNCFELDSHDSDGEEIEEDIQAMTHQRNHRTRTVNRAYANTTLSSNPFANLYDGLIRKSLRASQLWQAFLGTDIMFAAKRRSRDEAPASSLTKRIARGIYKPRRPWTAGSLLHELRRLHSNSQMQWRCRGQERALSAIMLWQEQIVVILPTGSGKSVLFMLPCTLPEAGVTILVVPLVALRGDLLRRVQELGIEYLEWTPDRPGEASLVFVSVEVASQKSFLTYAQRLVDAQRLDRIVVDECHLTITAAGYRESMVELRSIRRLRTQFVYLTATLPPSMQDEFEERNHLSSPTYVRESVHRANIRYAVWKVRTDSSLVETVARDLQSSWRNISPVEMSLEKGIVYVRHIAEGERLAQLLGCGLYSGADHRTEQEKSAFLQQWTRDPKTPFLVATTALAEGFDYPHVRVVIVVDVPIDLVVFGQETGRVGRDGKEGCAFVYVPSTFQPGAPSAALAEVASSLYDRSLWEQQCQIAVQRFLAGTECRRTVLSDFLDDPTERRWCIEGDVPCDICVTPHEQPIAQLLPLASSGAEGARMQHTGLDAIQQTQLQAQDELSNYRHDLASVEGTCLLCRARGEAWHHSFADCRQRFEVQEQRQAAIRRGQQRRQLRPGGWLAPYSACYRCLNPQTICPRAERRHDDGRPQQVECVGRDVVLPLCYGIWKSIDGRQWLQQHFQRAFLSIEEYLNWIGESSRFGGDTAIQGVRVASRRLREYSQVYEF